MQDHLNKINVFPVPDGDTGTNMAHTMNHISMVFRNSRIAPLLR
jgi:dihydroxyacetone kinase-like predicted kinase